MKTLFSLIEYGNPRLLSRNLRSLVFDFMETELKIGMPGYFEELIPQLYYLFNFLDAAADGEITKQPQTDNPDLLNEENSAAFLQEDEILKGITAFIVQTIHPERIYRILHQPLQEGGELTTDLLIVIPEWLPPKQFAAAETLIEAGCMLGTNLHFSLHHANQVKTAITEGPVFYSLVCTQANLLYWRNKNDWPEIDKEKRSTARQAAWLQFQKGFAKAAAFLKHAQQNSPQNDDLLTAFFLQQATELCCRAILTSITGIDKKTHTITSLKKCCRRCTTVVDEIFPLATDEDKRLLHLLDDAYLSNRYSNNYTISQTDLAVLLEKVTQLHKTAYTAVQHLLDVSA